MFRTDRDEGQTPSAAKIRFGVLGETVRTELHSESGVSSMIDAEREYPFRVAAWVMLLIDPPLVSAQSRPEDLGERPSRSFRQNPQEGICGAFIDVPVPDLPVTAPRKRAERVDLQIVRSGKPENPGGEKFVFFRFPVGGPKSAGEHASCVCELPLALAGRHPLD